MKTLVSMCSAVLIVLGAVSAALAAPGPCPDAGGTQYLVDTPAEAVAIAGGYSNNACDLVISVDVVPTVVSWAVIAQSFTATGAQIINTAPNSGISISVPRKITLTNSDLRARSLLALRSTGPAALGGGVEFTGSTLIASSTLAVGGLGGNLTVQADGPIIDSATTLYGGSRIHFIGGSTIAIDCSGGGANVCTDPASFCPGGVFPCSRTVNSEAEVLALFCGSGDPAPVCSGGANEVQFNAQGDIVFKGKDFAFLSHLTLESQQGSVDMAGTNGSTITDFQVSARTTVDLTGATWVVGKTARVDTGNGCLGPAECISATNASILAALHMLFSTHMNQGGINLCAGSFTRLAAGLPSMNGDAVLPYPASVKEDAAECAPLAAAVIQ